MTAAEQDLRAGLEQALAVADPWERRTALKQLAAALQQRTVSVYARPDLDLMLAYLRAEQHKRSHRRDLDAARRLYEHFTGKTLETLGAGDIRAYIQAR